MAEAIARHRYSDCMEPSSAGLFALGTIAGQTRATLIERGISADGLASKQLSTEALRETDVVINMSGRSGAMLATQGGPRVEDWDVSDPYGSDPDVYRRICDDIESRLESFAEELRAARKARRPSARRAPGRKRRGD